MLRRYTLVDRTLTHQLILQTTTGSGIHYVAVSCNCQAYKSANGKHVSYLNMGLTACLEDTARIYNDPDNHTKPFGEEDKLKW